MAGVTKVLMVLEENKSFASSSGDGGSHSLPPPLIYVRFDTKCVQPGYRPCDQERLRQGVSSCGDFAPRGHVAVSEGTLPVTAGGAVVTLHLQSHGGWRCPHPTAHRAARGGESSIPRCQCPRGGREALDGGLRRECVHHGAEVPGGLCFLSSTLFHKLFDSFWPDTHTHLLAHS